MPVHTDVVILGGGLHGLSCALQLARRGAAVVVLERDWIGRHAPLPMLAEYGRSIVIDRS